MQGSPPRFRCSRASRFAAPGRQQRSGQRDRGNTDPVERIGAARGITAATFGHALDGNVHPVVIAPGNAPETRRPALPAFEPILRVAPSVGGSCDSNGAL
jgi:FAD/FMN-containing dehydrogenase